MYFKPVVISINVVDYNEKPAAYAEVAISSLSPSMARRWIFIRRGNTFQPPHFHHSIFSA
jgi:hypothetical protein